MKVKVVILVSAALTLVAGCGSQQSADSSPQASSSSATSSSAAPPQTSTVSQFDARWMCVTPNQPEGWEELNRRITGDFQQFNLRPASETESMYGCNGCAPWTVALTAYAPGKYDAAKARKGRPLTVNADGDGFLLEDRAKHAATLTWQYAENAWATVRGMTSTTIEFDRMVELARALKPADRTPIRLPMKMPNVPATMPLAEINIDKSDYGTTLTFAPCGRSEVSGTGDCARDSETLNVQVWPDDGYQGHFQEQGAVPIKIGGKDGLFDDDLNGAGDHAAVQVHPGMLVVFDGGLPGPHYAGTPPEAPTSLKGILAGIEWAPDPANEATWPPVTDWTKWH
ncbi:MAG: hypothetical protein QOF67_369 [Mycobacterium sp.]|jgi:hypothetical protein|nr:hypothetical protein [Mycobacterium sp.]